MTIIRILTSLYNELPYSDNTCNNLLIFDSIFFTLSISYCVTIVTARPPRPKMTKIYYIYTTNTLA